MERLSRAESTVIAAGLLLAAALILYHAFDAQPLDPVIEPFPHPAHLPRRSRPLLRPLRNKSRPLPR